MRLWGAVELDVAMSDAEWVRALSERHPNVIIRNVQYDELDTWDITPHDLATLLSKQPLNDVVCVELPSTCLAPAMP